MLDSDTERKEGDPPAEEKAQTAPTSGTYEEITRKMEELGYFDCGRDI